MLILSIAGGFAFSYQEFTSEGIRSGDFENVIQENWKSFSQDYRLIKPKHKIFITESTIEVLERERLSSKVIKSVECNFQGIEPIELKTRLMNNYI